VAKYWNRIEFVPKASRKRSNILDFETYLQQRWQEGQQSAKALYEAILRYELSSDFSVIS
jgi:hypothetical protein